MIGKEELHTPGDGRGHVVVDLAKKIADCEGVRPITLQGNGRHTRTFTTIEDLVGAVSVLADRIQQGTFNVCGDRELSIADLAAMMWRITYDTAPMIQWDNREVDRDVRRRIGSSSKLFRDTGQGLFNDLEGHLRGIIQQFSKV